MDDSKLDELLGRYRAAAVPLPPGNLNQNVWREIRLRQKPSFSSALHFGEFLAWFRGRTTLVASALAMALLMSVSMTLLPGHLTSRQQVQQGLGLEVFSHQSSSLARLAQNP